MLRSGAPGNTRSAVLASCTSNPLVSVHRAFQAVAEPHSESKVMRTELPAVQEVSFVGLRGKVPRTGAVPAGSKLPSLPKVKLAVYCCTCRRSPWPRFVLP